MIILSKFEAIESRIASYSCPRGVPSRVHSSRLRKCFLNHRRLQSTTGQGDIHEDKHVEYAADPGRRNSECGEEGHTRHNSWDDGTSQTIKPQRARSYSMSLKYNTTAERNRFNDILKDFSSPEPKDQFEDASKKVFQALRAGNPQGVLEALLGAIGQNERYSMQLTVFLKDLPSSTFSEILRSLDPKHFLSQYAEYHREFGAIMAKRVGISHTDEFVDGYLEFAKIFLQQASSIIEARCSDRPPALSDFKYLLRCARMTGDLNAAERIWGSMEKMKDVTPDAECYNHLLATKCLDSEVKNDVWRYRLRVVRKYTDLRKQDNPPYKLTGHLLGPSPGGIKATTSQLFRKMVDSGVSGNEETFCYMMIAMAREADLAAVNSILQRVWGVDVEALMADSPEIPVKELPLDSPFYPSDQLLFAIAHCFGINNQIPTALRTLDFVSRQYSIQIPLKTWNELLQWTFVVSHKYNRKYKKGGKVISDGSDIPYLPLDSVSNLWHTMISEPYNIKPTMEMYNRLITNLLLRQCWGEVQYHILCAYELFKSDIKSLSRQLVILNRSHSRITSAEVIEQRLQQVHLSRLRVQRNRFYMHRWLKNLVKRASQHMPNRYSWSTQNIPNLVREWSQFLPHELQYQVAMGTVTMKIKSEKMETLRRLRANRPSILQYEDENEDALVREEAVDGCFEDWRSVGEQG